MAENHEDRPAGNRTASNVVNRDALRIPPTTDVDPLPRCMVCSRRLYVHASIAAGMGPECRRAITRALLRADSEVVAAVLAAIATLSGVKR